MINCECLGNCLWVYMRILIHVVCTNRRAMGFRRIMICFAQIYECQDPTNPDGVPRLRSNIASTQQLCKNEDSLNAKTKKHLRFVFETFNTIVRDYPEVFEGTSFRITKTFSPLELVTICCLISQWGDKRPIGMLKGDISALRTHLRTVHRDLRLYNVCWKTSWEFIENLERFRGTVDGSTSLKRRVEDGTVLDPRSRPGKSAHSGSQRQIRPEDPSNNDISTRGPGATSSGQRQEDLALLNSRAIPGLTPNTTPAMKVEGDDTQSQNWSGSFNNGGNVIGTAKMSGTKRAHADPGAERGGFDHLDAKKVRLAGNPGRYPS